MQGIATFSLMFSLGLAYVINPIDDSLFFKALDGIISGIYGKEVLDELNNSAVAGMLVGLFAGTLFVFLSMNKKVYNYSILFLFLLRAKAQGDVLGNPWGSKILERSIKM